MIPVVFIHFGDLPEYAEAVFAQARARGNEVTVLNPSQQEVYEHRFARVYQHLSTNHVYFELACMVRWFTLNDWMTANGVTDCLYCDTDVLLFSNVESEIHSDPYYHAQDFTLSLGTSGHTSYWKENALDHFCETLWWTYSEKKNKTYGELVRIFNEMRAQDLPGGVSDMLLLKLFAGYRRGQGKDVGEMSVPRGEYGGKLWDHNVNASDGVVTEPAPMGGERKQMWFKNGDAFSRWADFEGSDGIHFINGAEVRFLSLHCQGGAKAWIPDYLAQSKA